MIPIPHKHFIENHPDVWQDLDGRFWLFQKSFKITETSSNIGQSICLNVSTQDLTSFKIMKTTQPIINNSFKNCLNFSTTNPNHLEYVGFIFKSIKTGWRHRILVVEARARIFRNTCSESTGWGIDAYMYTYVYT